MRYPKIGAIEGRRTVMRILLIYTSIHHDNTKKIAQMMAKTVEAELFEANEKDNFCIEQYDLIGFGSGIYFGKHHKRLFQIIEHAPVMGKDVFVFSTSGTGKSKSNKHLIELLSTKGANVKANFSCKGYDTYSVFKLIGGIAKGHPNNKDIEDANDFIRRLVTQTV